MKKYIILLVLLLSLPLLASRPWFPSRKAHQAYLQKDYPWAKEILQNEQAEKPNDPLINFNLGTVYYKEHNYDTAKDSFMRAATNAPHNSELLEKANFNLGNTLYQSALAPLPENWEQEVDKLDEKVRNQAIAELKTAIEKYTLAIKQNKINKRTKTNKTIAEKTLAKLEKKQNQQNKDNKQQNKDKQQQDKQQEKQQQKQDQNKQQDKDDQEQKDQQKQEQNKDQQQQEQNKQQDKQDQNKQQNKDDQEQKDQQKQEKQQQQEKQKNNQPQQENQPRNLDERKTEAVLAQLQQAEKDLQKKLFAQKVQMSKKSNNKYQKPW